MDATNKMDGIKKIYSRYYWMTKYALVEDCGEISDRLFKIGYKNCVRMERVYGDIFEDVRVSVSKEFIYLGDGQWACKLKITH